jgi:hypothetical protein
VADGGKTKVSIRWNGREVSDPSELPPELRKLLEDADGNGIPDIAERGKLGSLAEGDRLEVETVTSTVIDLDGKKYQSIDELPPELREAARAALSRASGSPTARGARPLDPSSSREPKALPGAMEPVAPPRPVGPSWTLVLLAVLAGAAVMYLLLRPHR